MSTTPLFPTQIWHSSLKRNQAVSALLKQLLKEAYTFRELDSEGVKWSKKHYWGGYTSYASISNLHERSSNFEGLKRHIDAAVLKYTKALGWDLDVKELRMSAFWINIMGEGCHHSFHLHPLSVISGTVYLQVPKGSGVFKVEDPRLSQMMGVPMPLKSAPQALQRHVGVVTQPGDLLLFESWLKHEVPANFSSVDRVSISFNYDWARR